MRNCEQCGKSFEERHGGQVYCSVECRRAHAKAVEKAQIESEKQHYTFKCGICGKEFTTTTRNRKTCGDPECRKEYTRRLMQKKRQHKEVEVETVAKDCKHKNCIYRSQGTIQTCDYILFNRKPRGCSISKCDKYVPGKRKQVTIDIPKKSPEHDESEFRDYIAEHRKHD